MEGTANCPLSVVVNADILVKSDEHKPTWCISNHEEHIHQQKPEKVFEKNLRTRKRKLKHTDCDIYSEWISCPISNLLYHYTVGASELQASGEVKGVHPAQDKCKHHHRHIGLNARQVESSCDHDQHRIDETREERGKQ